MSLTPPIGHLQVILYLYFKIKRVLVQKLSYKEEFDLHENERVGGSISIWMVSHEDSFSHRDKRQLGIGLLSRLGYMIPNLKKKHSTTTLPTLAH